MSQMIESFMQPGAPAGACAQPLELEAARRAEGAALACDPNPLLAIQVKLQVCLGAVSMTVGQLLAAREGQVLALDRAVDAPVDLLLEGKVGEGADVAVSATATGLSLNGQEFAADADSLMDAPPPGAALN